MTHRFFFSIFAIFIACSVLSAACLGGTLPVVASSESPDTALTVAPPVLVSPPNKTILHVARPDFDWQDIPGAAGYQIQASRQSRFRTLLLDETTISSDYASASDLPGGVRVFWRVRALVDGTYTAWSQVWRFTTGKPPSTPVLLSPDDGAEVADLSPRLDWEDSTVPRGVRFAYYQLQVATDNGFAAIVHEENISGVTNSQADLPSLTAGIVYFWRVRSFNTRGDFSAWSQVRSFEVSSAPPPAVRPLPDTWDGIHVFNDQLWLYGNQAWIEFSATHYVGTQKMVRSDADALRAVNPNFIILNYRLGIGLGYRAADNWQSCNLTGDWLAVVEGDEWVREWPGDANVQENWFYHWPESGNTRVVNCDWGWYLMNPADPGWRSYWSGEVLRQLDANDADGVFADSFSVPNYLGYDHYKPDLPAVDAAFESAWTARLEDFMTFAQSGELAPYYFIPNAGMLVTTRDTTDYSLADGVMVEGFGEWGGGSYFDPADWELQMNSILNLVKQDKAIIAQPYVDAADVNDRMFLLANYLLIKGHHTYLNLEYSMEPEWFPEYEIPIGNPTGADSVAIADLWNSSWGVYVRTYSNGLVLVNPNAGSRPINLGQTYYRATPVGGGIVPDDGDTSAWMVTYTPVTQVTVAANQAVVLLTVAP